MGYGGKNKEISPPLQLTYQVVDQTSQTALAAVSFRFA